MRIGINAFPLRNDGGGARFVFTGLLDALLRLDQQNKYLIFSHFEGLRLIHEVLRHHTGTLGELGPDPRVRVVEISDPGQITSYHLDFDLLFGPLNNLQPRLYDRPTVAILHDIQEQYFPEYFSQAELLGRFEDYPEIAHSATTLIAISQGVKQSFIDKFHVDPRKIEVIYNAPQARLVDRASGDQGNWNRDVLPDRYFFYPANTYKHKNHELLLDALVELRQATGDCPHLIFCGHQVFGGYPLNSEITRRGLVDHCRLYSGLSADEMRFLYCHAIATVMPTMFEGFGMPAVEALACGCPLVCSDLSVLREVAGETALYFPPGDRAGLINQLQRIQSDSELHRRLSETGHSVVAKFHWDTSATRLQQVFLQAPDRFRWGFNGKPARPLRIGVLLRLIHDGSKIVETVKSLICQGYADLVIRVICQEQSISPNLRDFLRQAGVEYESPSDVVMPGSGTLERFAQDRQLDLVLEALEGHVFRHSALDSIAWAGLESPDQPVLLGEVMEWRGGSFLRIGRMRITGDGLWKLEGFLYPEMFVLNVRAFNLWAKAKTVAQSDQIEWRWDLLRLARTDDRLFLMRRTLADCDIHSIGLWARYHAIKAGMYRFYSVYSDQPRKIKRLRWLEPVVKRASLILPQRWQDAGTRVWYRITR